MLRRQFVHGSIGLGAMAQTARFAGVFDVRGYGAAGDGTRLDTKDIQAAIDACASAGGGAVFFPSGRYLSGTIYLKTNVVLHLEAGAVLLGSKNLQDYPPTVPALRSYTDNYTDKSLIYAENLENIGIEGRGTIDGQGALFEGPYKVRPYMMRIVNCRNVAVGGVTVINSPMWVQHYLSCDGVTIHGITIHSRVNHNNDGIDIDCCDRVRISDCEISSGDDAIVLKSTSDRPCRNVTITNCVLSSHCNAFKLGTETNGGFENITLSNCTIYDTRLAGIALEIVDGGTLDRVNVSNVTMHKVGGPIFIRLGDRARPFEQGGQRPEIGKLRNVVISDVQVTGGGRVGCAISGIPGHPIENVTLDNVRLKFEGGGKKEDSERDVPEHPEKYPEYNMFGTLPAYGFYCRHVRGISLRNVATGFERPDERPALVCEDVEALEVSAADLSAVPDGGPAIRLSQVRGAFIHGCRARADIRTYLQVAGSRTERVSLVANDLAPARTVVEVAPDVPKGAVIQDAGKSL